ncbi:MAG: peptidoglycan recognition protein family protein [Bryobacteraceae bacterium]
MQDSFIEKSAALIPDQVLKLRYLRWAFGRREAPKAPPARYSRFAWAVCTVLLVSNQLLCPVTPNLALPAAPPFMSPSRPGKIWIAEQHASYFVYSDGLQIRTDYQTTSSPRVYRAYSRAGLVASDQRSVPAGIVYHTTESVLLPLEAGSNRSLLTTREDLLDHVRRDRLYNFVIDRFGQVFRIVPPDEVAYHAGHSVWADTKSVYCGLNESFIGVSFEARTAEAFDLTAAQIHSGRMLTDALRNLYDIPVVDCVTHAQVSVNPVNMHIGFHTDWASRFPFEKLGLAGGYDTPLAAIELFGFEYDDHFLRAIGGVPWKGLAAAEEQLARNAGKHGVSLRSYRTLLQQQYQNIRRESNESTGNGDRA